MKKLLLPIALLLLTLCSNITPAGAQAMNRPEFKYSCMYEDYSIGRCEKQQTASDLFSMFMSNFMYKVYNVRGTN